MFKYPFLHHKKLDWDRPDEICDGHWGHDYIFVSGFNKYKLVRGFVSVRIHVVREEVLLLSLKVTITYFCLVSIGVN